MNGLTLQVVILSEATAEPARSRRTSIPAHGERSFDSVRFADFAQDDNIRHLCRSPFTVHLPPSNPINFRYLASPAIAAKSCRTACCTQ